jgi:hypothetical protein
VIKGRRREGRQVVAYKLRSHAFEVRRWDGITVPDIRADGDGVSFAVGPTSTYAVPSAPPGGGSRIEQTVVGKGSGDVVATVGPIDYPDSYESPARFINPTRTVMRDPAAPNDTSKFEWYCFNCSFRPWIDTGEPECTEATHISASGRARQVRANESGGRWVAPIRLRSGELALVRPGGVEDTFGQINSKASDQLGEGTTAARRTANRLSETRTTCG